MTEFISFETLKKLRKASTTKKKVDVDKGLSLWQYLGIEVM